jgi:hypothetical protein
MTINSENPKQTEYLLMQMLKKPDQNTLELPDLSEANSAQVHEAVHGTQWGYRRMQDVSLDR